MLPWIQVIQAIQVKQAMQVKLAHMLVDFRVIPILVKLLFQFCQWNNTIFFSRLILIVKLWHLNRLQQPESLWQALWQAEPYLAFLAWQLYALASFEALWIAGKGEADNRMQRCLRKLQKRNFIIHIHTCLIFLQVGTRSWKGREPENCITVLSV